MRPRTLFLCSLLALALASCAPIRTETVSIGRARSSCLNNTVDFGWDGGVINYHAMRGIGVDLLIHRATRGGSGTDEDYARRETGARAAGLKWGAYHYIKRSENVHAQMHRFVSTVKAVAARNGTLGYPVMLVLDNEGKDRVTWDTLANLARLVRSRTGTWPLLYCSVPLAGTAAWHQQCRELEHLTGHDRDTLRSCGLWVPRYGDAPSSSMSFSVPTVFGDWTFWQYCGDVSGHPRHALAAREFTGQVGAAYTRSGGRPSLRHFCDRNLFNGSRSAFESFYRSHSSAPANWR